MLSVINFSVGSVFFMEMKMLRWASAMLMLDLPRIGFNSRVTGVVILLLMMTAWVASWRVRSMIVVSVSSFWGVLAIKLSFSIVLLFCFFSSLELTFPLLFLSLLLLLFMKLYVGGVVILILDIPYHLGLLGGGRGAGSLAMIPVVDVVLESRIEIVYLFSFFTFT